jgi:hypothetical protein
LSADPPSESIRGLPPPVSELPWSSDFVMQAIEILPVARSTEGIVWYRPEHAESFVVGWPARAKPDDVARGALERLGMRARVLHSTSWRHADDEVVLTYLAVVEPATQVPESWHVASVTRVELARGDTTAPPATIDVSQVVEHALRHLAWLVRDDPVITRELRGWAGPLEAYVPEPFRSLGPTLPQG